MAAELRKLEHQIAVRVSPHVAARRLAGFVFAFRDRDEIGPRILAHREADGLGGMICRS